MLQDLMKDVLGENFSKKAKKFAFKDIAASNLPILNEFAVLKHESLETSQTDDRLRQPVFGTPGAYRRGLSFNPEIE